MDNKTAVIMSVYNNDCSLFLEEAIKSILEQSFINFTLFIYIDGPVKSELEKILRTYEQLKNVSIHFGQANKGLAYGLNYLINLVVSNGTYEFIARMDSDDISLKDRLQTQIEYMRSNPDIDILGSYCEEFGASFSKAIKKVPVTNKEIYEYSILRCPLIHPTVVFRLSSLSESLSYPENTRVTEDMALWFILMCKGFKFANIPVVLLRYRMTEDTVERRLGAKKGLSEFSLRLKYMFKLKKLSLINVIGVSSRLVFHIMPVKMARYFYKRLR